MAYETLQAILARTVTDSNRCLVWQGALSIKGYGYKSFQGRNWSAHRLTYTLSKGEIPEELEIDHLCRNRACINPDHLEAVTHAVNLSRRVNTLSIGGSGKLLFCKRGHKLEEPNLYIYPNGTRKGDRGCRACRKIVHHRNNRDYYVRRKLMEATL